MSLNDSLADTNRKAKAVSEKFFNTTYDYYKLKIFQQLTASFGIVFKTIFIGSMLMIGLTFIAIAAAFLIGKALGNYTHGFLIVGGVFILLSLIAFMLRKHMSNFIVKTLSEKFFN
ncbi:hypothetical protein Q4566_13070 [Tamlana sp. 2_MG-2023]|uniref:hypothetical protein n=1 Tax=unclassified Tamlana TaxID=2614803 RepID=UPI0026E3967A|nr:MULTISPECIES: hypothetical protein [unclassified Tamlana]MDO6761136.1 hypothetical protein [Tamlana sp. 2_MG-2023]MDO6791531.1 hypothetical protein [Tamlana sp. 1_MG-2023]